MRTFLFVLLLCLSTAVHAKKKAIRVEAKTTSTALKSPEIKELSNSNTYDFYDAKYASSKTQFNVSQEKSFTPTDYLAFSDHFFNESENSYNNVLYSGGGSATAMVSPLMVHEATIDTAELFRQGMFYGFAVMLVLLNLTCFFLFEEKSFLFYSFSLASLSLLLFFSDGLVGLFFTDVTHSFSIETLLLLGAVGLQILFASKYLSLKEFAPKLKWSAMVMLTIAAIASAFHWVTDNQVFSHIANLSLFSVLITYFLTGVSLFSRKNYAKFYVIATFIPLLFSIDFFILRPMGIEFLGTDSGHIKAAAIAEMIILTYGIMYRMQAVKEENELRQVEMRIFLKRQEVITARRKTEKMVEDVYLENLIMHYDLDGLEIKLLQYISEGKNNTKIARKLKTTISEVEELTKELYHKLEIGEQIQQDYRLVDQQPDYIYN